jgi:hypothetical protein
MATTEHDAIHSELCRLYIAKRHDLGMADRTDEEIAARTGDITLFLAARVGMAQASGDDAFLQRYRWLVAAFERLDQGKRIVGLDG